MPKVILNINQEQSQNIKISSSTKTKIENDVSLKTVLRKKRSEKYMEAIGKLDTSAHTLDKEKKEEFMKAINEEFETPAVAEMMLGIVAKCYLGAPYEVHTLDMLGNIITHYKKGESLPAMLEKARNISLNLNYAFIEVYKSYMVAVKKDGSVAIIE